jgi:hypothetical protein
MVRTLEKHAASRGISPRPECVAGEIIADRLTRLRIS